MKKNKVLKILNVIREGVCLIGATIGVILFVLGCIFIGLCYQLSNINKITRNFVDSFLEGFLIKLLGDSWKEILNATKT